jgi:hypothetical protein
MPNSISNMQNLIKITLALLILIADFATISAQQRLPESQFYLAGSDDELNIPSFLNAEKEESKPHKSKFLALGLSFVLPGAGHYYTGNKSRMIIFGTNEALIWSGFFGFRFYGSWKKEDYRAWSSFHAGAMVNGKDDRFFEKMTYYDSRNEFNQLEMLYEGDNANPFPISEDYFWNWDSDASRVHYRELRNQSKNAYRRSLLLLGVAMANRLISAIDAYRSAGRSEKVHEFNAINLGPYYTLYQIRGAENLEIGVSLRF